MKGFAIKDVIGGEYIRWKTGHEHWRDPMVNDLIAVATKLKHINRFGRAKRVAKKLAGEYGFQFQEL